MSETPKTAFLGLLAVGVEYSLKYFEQYFRWSSSEMQLSRHVHLASWSYSFFERGIGEYNQTKTEIAVSGLDAVARRIKPEGQVRASRLRILRSLYAIHTGPAADCRPEVRRAIALAMALPGFRKAVMRRDRPLTLLLPSSEDATAVLELLYDLGDPRSVFDFLLMHVVPGRLALKTGQTFVLERAASQPSYCPRLRIADAALVESLSAAVTGRIASQATYLNDDLIAYTATMHYGRAGIDGAGSGLASWPIPVARAACGIPRQ